MINPRPALTACLAGLLLLGAPASAQVPTGGVLEGRARDRLSGRPIAAAAVTLRSLRPAARGDSERTVATDSAGRYRFEHLSHGEYALRITRFDYRAVTVEVTLARAQPLVLELSLEPVAFALDPVLSRGLRRPGPSLVAPPLGHSGGNSGDRVAAVRARQQRFLSSDARQLGHEDIRESNTLIDDDVFRALQSVPGVARRDDFTADLWTRGASAGQTAVSFDGVPLVGALHALGILSGVNSDMLHTATFQRGVTSAATQGGGAAVIELESRSPASGLRARRVSLSPISARFTMDGAPSERLAWALGVRRSHVHFLSRFADGLMPGSGALRYSFDDVTARADVLVTPNARIEVSAFQQSDEVFGDVAGVATGNEGAWGTSAARASLVTVHDGHTLRHTLGMSDFGASLRITPSLGPRAPLHPPTENHYRTLLWESRFDAAPAMGSSWSAGLTGTLEHHVYNGPGVDPAILLTPDELARRGVVDFASLVLAIDRSRLVHEHEATRLALWGTRRGRLGAHFQYESGLRVESGDPVAGAAVRLAPRVLVRYGSAASPLTISAAYGRSFQYTQSIARTDVLRPGLRASEVLVQADPETAPLRSDLFTLGAELWRSDAWLLGATGWWRSSAGIVLPQPHSGPLDQPRETVQAHGTARGVELSVRRLEGRIRGFANYSLSRARHRVDDQEFDAAEDRTHIANVAVRGDLGPSWQVGSTFRFESGAPFTRVTLVSPSCGFTEPCSDATPVLLGTSYAQRGPAYASLDLTTQWTYATDDWSISIHAQLSNVLGRSNAVTYHSSCICDGGAAPGSSWAGDRFEPGLPRLPIAGLRVRF